MTIEQKPAIMFYKTLSIHQRINLKDECTYICGIPWDVMNEFINPIEKYQILSIKIYELLIIEKQKKEILSYHEFKKAASL